MDYIIQLFSAFVNSFLNIGDYKFPAHLLNFFNSDIKSKLLYPVPVSQVLFLCRIINKAVLRRKIQPARNGIIVNINKSKIDDERVYIFAYILEYTFGC